MSKITCPKCQGMGGISGAPCPDKEYAKAGRCLVNHMYPCPTCHGTGTIEEHTKYHDPAYIADVNKWTEPTTPSTEPFKKMLCHTCETVIRNAGQLKNHQMLNHDIDDCPIPDTSDTPKDKLIEQLKALSGNDPESTHYDADMLLLEYINDPKVTEAFDELDKWYS